MSTRNSPYNHSDGSNCWTKNCSLGHTSSLQSFAVEGKVDEYLAAREEVEKKPSAKTLASFFGIKSSPKKLDMKETLDNFPTIVSTDDNYRLSHGAEYFLENGIKNKRQRISVESIYLFGQCFTYAMVMKKRFPNHIIREAYIPQSALHVYTVDPKTKKAYDIRGEFKNEEALLDASLSKFMSSKDYNRGFDTPTFDIVGRQVRTVTPKDIEDNYSEKGYIPPTKYTINLATKMVNSV